MSSPAQFSGTVSFGEFELDLATAELRNNGSTAFLPGQPFQILLTLLSRPGQLVTREELKRKLWPSDTYVDFDVGLNKAVNRLREALGDSAEKPRFIETLPRKGYRFISQVGNGVGISNPKVAPLNDQLAARHTSGQETTSEVARSRWSRSSAFRYVPAVAITLLIAAVVVISSKFLRPRIPDLAQVHIAKVTDSGGARDVAISPEGHYVVYSLSRGEKESLRLRQISTRSDVEILPPGPAFHGLTFSPDGNYVYFVRSDLNDPYFKYLYSVPVLGGPVRQMIADVDSPITFSPDGQHFAFERAVVPRNVIELRIANSDATGERVIATIQNGDAGLFQPGPNWSRDGRTIACPFRILGSEIRWILATVSVPKGEVREIYSDMAPLGRPVWLSERSLLIPRYDAAYDRWQLGTISHPDGEARRFTNDLADYDQPLDIAQDGKTVVGMASRVVSNIWEAHAGNLSHARQITFGELPLMNVVETADGQLLSSGGDGQVWRVKADGQRDAFRDLRSVGWVAACGSLILFTSFEANAVTLTRVNEDGSRLAKLFSGDLSYQGCSRDGQFAYYVNQHRPQKIWKLSTEGGPPVEVAPGMGEGISGWLDVSPDGTLLSYTFDQYRPTAWKLAVIPASGGSAIKIFEVPGGTTRVRWSTTGASLQFLVTRNGATNLWEQPLAGGKPKQLTNFTSGRIFDFHWSSDHRRLLLSRGDVTSDVVLLSNLH
jgi:DNA-binding winged helix-turn-helix (wHTH) protein/Tol biopolymer transport system component